MFHFDLRFEGVDFGLESLGLVFVSRAGVAVLDVVMWVSWLHYWNGWFAETESRNCQKKKTIESFSIFKTNCIFWEAF